MSTEDAQAAVECAREQAYDAGLTDHRMHDCCTGRGVAKAAEKVALTDAETDWFREECMVCLGDGCRKCEAVRDEVDRIVADRVAEAVERERAQQADRLMNAAANLDKIAAHSHRVAGKREGVLLALSYIEEDQRIARGDTS